MQHRLEELEVVDRFRVISTTILSEGGFGVRRAGAMLVDIVTRLAPKAFLSHLKFFERYPLRPSCFDHCEHRGSITLSFS